MPNQTLLYFLKLISESKRLNFKEENILIYRLKQKKLRQIGKKYKITAERIRQIEKKALKKMASKIFQEKLFKI
ncbi:MAG: sigma factor-like helix-turn-helix DNA-binding protein [Microgenomates group bacterium]|nr:sigma factor-like helix-turn-helix DNA-binding protein [Microgenomates group bacterium]